jgi:transcriptional regulator with XRE-family HTH domain
MRKTKAPELLRFGDNVRRLREQREWAQEQLAENLIWISGIESLV